MSFAICFRRLSFSVLFLGASAFVACPLRAQTAQSLQGELNTLAARAQPGVFGIAVVDLADNRRWSVRGEQDFPMMSDFKAPVAAAVLARVDAGRLSLARKITLEPSQYVPGSAVPSIGARVAQGSVAVTVADLLHAAVSQSDNTSVDALIRLLGGAREVTEYLRAKGVAGMQITSSEGGNAAVFEHLQGADGPPAGETAGQRNARFLLGYKAYIAAPPNRTTPDASALFLEKLAKGKLLSRASTAYLLHVMEQQTIPRRLRAGVPGNIRIADKTGSSGTIDELTAAYNDTAILTAPDGHEVVIAAYLTRSDARAPDRDALFAALARDVVAALLSSQR